MTPTPAETDLFTALRALLLTIVPSGTEVVKGLDNRVPEPTSENYVLMMPPNMSRLSTNAEDWTTGVTAPTVVTTTMATGLDVELDVHGPAASDIAIAIAQVFRSDYAVQFMADNSYAVLPQYAADPRQSAFVNGEGQYEPRYIVVVTFQSATAVDIPAQFATDIVTTVQTPADLT